MASRQDEGKGIKDNQFRSNHPHLAEWKDVRRVSSAFVILTARRKEGNSLTRTISHLPTLRVHRKRFRMALVECKYCDPLPTGVTVFYSKTAFSVRHSGVDYGY